MKNSQKNTRKNSPKTGTEIAIIKGAAEIAEGSVSEKQDAKPIEIKFGQVTEVPLNEIQTSPFNPRKDQSEEDLMELADSIRQFGLLQPILVRPRDGNYEIVFGERRYLAHLYANKETIPAHIMDISDADAEDMAITENLQRKDITPFEEAKAYQRLIDIKRYDVPELVVKFGKDEKYIRSRLKLNNLIDEVARMLKDEQIMLGIALEFAKYDEDIQREVYKDHFTDGYSNWMGLTVKEFATKLIGKYMCRLDLYEFDKTECETCGHNSVNQVLFSDCGDCGNCQNRQCLLAKNKQYLIDAVVRATTNDARLLIGDGWRDSNKEVYEYLAEMGYPIETMNGKWRYETADVPEYPDAEEYESTEDFEEAVKEYRQEMEEFKRESMELEQNVQEGNWRKYVVVENNRLNYYYDQVGENETSLSASEPPTQAQIIGKQIDTLRAKDVRNLEIANENIVADTKKLYAEKNIPNIPYSENEEKWLFFAMLPKVDPTHYKALGIKDKSNRWSLTDEDMQKIIDNLTDRHKAIIIREFLKDYFRGAAYGKGLQSVLYMQMAAEHFPDESAVIRAKYEEVYNKRHSRLLERIGGMEKEIALLDMGDGIEEAVVVGELPDESPFRSDKEMAALAAGTPNDVIGIEAVEVIDTASESVLLLEAAAEDDAQSDVEPYEHEDAEPVIPDGPTGQDTEKSGAELSEVDDSPVAMQEVLIDEPDMELIPQTKTKAKKSRKAA